MKQNALNFHLISLVVLLCVLMGALSVEGAIVNGGFENTTFNPLTPFEPTIDSWVVSTGGNTAIHSEDTGTNVQPWLLAPKAGGRAASFSSDQNAVGAGGSLTQTLTTVSSNSYNLSMWIANPVQDSFQNTEDYNVFSVRWAGTLVTLSGSYITGGVAPNTYVVAPETNWFQITAIVQGTGVASDLVISARNNNWATLVDEVMFEQTPEPSTVVMLGAGAAIVGLRRRRQQRSL